MGLRGPRAKPKATGGDTPGRKRRPAWQRKGLTRAQRVIRFCESLTVTSGAHAGRKVKLRPWQREIIEDWYKTARGRRVIRTGLLSMARKNGKSTLAAALGLAHLVGPEAESRGHIVIAASDKDQSGVVFDEVVAFIEAEPDFDAAVNIKRREKVIEHLENGSRLTALSSDAKKSHGLSPSVVILDELAQWGTGTGRRLYDALVTATGARAEPLTIVISTQSEDDLSLMSELVDYGKQVNEGIIDNLTFSARVFEVPDDLDIWNEEHWALANPALGDFRSLEEMREFAERARRMPTLRSTFENLYLNRRVAAEERWIPKAEWDACAGDISDAEISGLCFGGLDLASVSDLNSFDLFWPASGALLSWSWCPKDRILERSEKDRVPYDVWARQGWIELTNGRAADKRAIALRIGELCALYKPKVVGFDKFGMPELVRILGEEGIELPLKEVRQGFLSLSVGTKEFEGRVLNRALRHNRNPVLTWALSNVRIARDAAGNIKPDKERSREKIDPVVAGVMAVGLAAAEPKPEELKPSLWVLTA